jgi:hypothetical protein
VGSGTIQSGLYGQVVLPYRWSLEQVSLYTLAGSTPTGSTPTGSAPTGSAPTGSAPTGSTPTGINAIKDKRELEGYCSIGF